MSDTLENLNPESSSRSSNYGGARPGAGRPKGKKNPETILREEASKQFKERVAKHVDKLFNAQLSLAVGTQSLFVVHTDSKGKRRKPEMVTNVDVISRFLDENEGVDGVMDNGYAPDSKAKDYYFLTTALPNNQALEGLLNRSFGKAQEKVDFTTDGESLNNRKDMSDEELDARIRQYLEARAS